MATKKTTKKTAPKKAKKQRPVTTSKHEATLELFCEFMALPTPVRGQVFKDADNNPIENQGEFAKEHNIDQARLSKFKRTDDYVNKVSKIRRRYFKGEIGDAIYAVMLNTIQHGKGADLKVLLEYAKEVERDDPMGETGETLNSILKKLDNMIPG